LYMRLISSVRTVCSAIIGGGGGCSSVSVIHVSTRMASIGCIRAACHAG
jgi:hypothetical protein